MSVQGENYTPDEGRLVAGGAPDELVIPEDLSVLTDEELAALRGQAVEQFNAVYGDGQGLSVEAVDALKVLTTGIEALAGEAGEREAAEAQRSAEAAELAARVNGPAAPDESGDGDPGEGEPGEGDTDTDGEGGSGGEGDTSGEGDTAPVVEAIAASGRRPELRVNLGALARRTPTTPAREVHRHGDVRDVLVASGDGGGYATGQGITWDDAARILDHRLGSFSQSQYEAAAAAGRHMRQQTSILTLHRPTPEDLTVRTSSFEDAMTVMDRAADESRLPGGSLVAAGGWCAPSEVLWDMCEVESREGLYTLPEIGVRRGGIQWTQGVDFQAIFDGSGFAFTEEQDEGGLYAEGGTAGDKPCYRVPCVEWEEARLAVAGLCITSGLLQARAFPELLARTIRGALIAHDHKMATNVLNAVVAGSTAVTMPTGQVGAAAPILTAVELQAEHYKYVRRMSRSATLEAVFPFWARGLIRSDLSRRLGVDMLSVSDAQIDGWFRARGINPQFVYSLDPLTGDATAATAWPATVRFLLYSAGTWVRGSSDVITLDTIYDSTMLGQNDFTALFTEEGWLVAQRCPDSRVVSVPVCPDGATAAGVDIACNGGAATP